MSSHALPVLFAVLIWWFATGLILLLDGLPRTTFRWSHLIASVLALGAAVGLAHTAQQTSVAGAYCAFTCALLVWGWHELTFLTGWITGPRRLPAEAHLRGWARFGQAVRVLLWHELAILGSGVAIAAITWGAPNQVGTATFAVLWLMRISAKLNVHWGVRNLSTEWLPAHLRYLGSYFRQRPMNAFWPVAVAASTIAAIEVVGGALEQRSGSAAHAGGLLVGTLLVLAIVEHWLLVLPLQATALWRWALRQPRDLPPEAAIPRPPPSRLASPSEPPHPTLDAADAKLLHAR